MPLNMMVATRQNASCLQVREALMTSAQLRLPQSMPVAEKRARVDQIITELVSPQGGHTAACVHC